MSYCVNCGVKLRSSEKKCPLCNTIVINPNNKDIDYKPAYSNKMEKFNKINYDYVGKLLVSIVLLISFIFLFSNYIISKSITWSIYVVIFLFYMNCHFQYFLQKNVYVAHFIELICTELFVLVIALLNNGLHWYLYLALPFVSIIWLYVILCTYLIKRKGKNALRRFLTALFFSSLTLIAVECAFDLYYDASIKLVWSLYASLPIILICIVFYILSFNAKLINEIKQRMFI